MVLELINIFATPYNEVVTDHLTAADYAAHNCSDNGLLFFVDDQLKQQKNRLIGNLRIKLKFRMSYKSINGVMHNAIKRLLMKK